jgi:hypothetical protein
MASHLQELFGQKLTAVMTGTRDPKAVGEWARGERSPHRQVEERLRHAYHVALYLGEMESAETVRAWFMGMNPHLDDHAPALVIREDPRRVMQAARAFLASG